MRTALTLCAVVLFCAATPLFAKECVGTTNCTFKEYVDYLDAKAAKTVKGGNAGMVDVYLYNQPTADKNKTYAKPDRTESCEEQVAKLKAAGKDPKKAC